MLREVEVEVGSEMGVKSEKRVVCHAGFRPPQTTSEAIVTRDRSISWGGRPRLQSYG